MKPHEQRVIDEKKELDVKLEALRRFEQGDVFHSVPEEDRLLLIQQWNAMNSYSEILAKRIERFKA